MSLLLVTPKLSPIYAVEFTGKNKATIKEAVKSFATVRDEGEGLAISDRESRRPLIINKGQFLVIDNFTLRIYTRDGFEAFFVEVPQAEPVVEAPKTPAKSPAKPAAKPKTKEPVTFVADEEEPVGSVAESVVSK